VIGVKARDDLIGGGLFRRVYDYGGGVSGAEDGPRHRSYCWKARGNMKSAAC